MGLLNWIGFGKELAEPINAVGTLYTTDKERIDAQTKYQEVNQKPQLARLDINKVLALSSNIFNSGWQSLLGWTAGFLVLLYYAPQIIIATYVWGTTAIQTGVVAPFPIPADQILNLVYLLFGVGVHSLAKGKN